MADEFEPRPAIPWHLWVVGGVSLLWNMMGAVDFTMTLNHNEAYLAQFTPEQIAYFESFPVWAEIAWGVATWASVVGSILLLFRKCASVQFFGVSIVGMVLTTLYNFVLSDGLKVMGSGVGPLIFSAIIWIVAILLFVYARALTKRGVLR